MSMLEVALEGAGDDRSNFVASEGVAMDLNSGSAPPTNPHQYLAVER